MSINCVVLSGNLGHDAELKYTKNSTPILTFSIAVSDYRKTVDGVPDYYTNWVNCNIIGTRAEKLEGRLLKGMKIALSGKLHYSSWTADNGKKRSSLEVTVDTLEFMSRDDNSAPSQKEEPEQSQDGYYDDTIPF